MSSLVGNWKKVGDNSPAGTATVSADRDETVQLTLASGTRGPFTGRVHEMPGGPVLSENFSDVHATFAGGLG